MKIPVIIARWLFILCIPVLLISASIAIVANSLWLYKYDAGRYGVSQNLAEAGLELTDPEVGQVYNSLVSYFNSGEEYVNIVVAKDGQPVSLFTPEETIHFKDVKGLVRLDYWILAGTAIYFLAFAGASIFWLRDRRQLLRVVAWGGGLTLALVAALLLLNTLSGFSQLFYQFHLVFFNNLFWSSRGYMIMLFPEGFFIDAAGLGIIITIAGALAMLIAGTVYMKRHPA